MARSEGLCALARRWRLDGFVRMEMGFEVLYCDFAPGGGLDLASMRGAALANETVGAPRRYTRHFEWARGAAERYHGLPAGRVRPDWAGMVSAFFYDANTTNPDPARPELPRAVAADAEARRGVRARLAEVLELRRGGGPSAVDWQGVADGVVGQFAARVRMLAERPGTVAEASLALEVLLAPFLDYPADADVGRTEEPARRCAEHYLLAARASEAEWTPEERAIAAAVEAVARTTCGALFEMRRVAGGEAPGGDAAAARVQDMARTLMGRLNWATWKECGRCERVDEVCFVAMFPLGSVEDHFSPRCKSRVEFGEVFGDYFGFFPENYLGKLR